MPLDIDSDGTTAGTKLRINGERVNGVKRLVLDGDAAGDKVMWATLTMEAHPIMIKGLQARFKWTRWHFLKSFFTGYLGENHADSKQA